MQALKLGKFSFLSGRKKFKKSWTKFEAIYSRPFEREGAQYDVLQLLFYLVGFVAFPLMVQTETMPC